jgi:hypothetical protein
MSERMTERNRRWRRFPLWRFIPFAIFLSPSAAWLQSFAQWQADITQRHKCVLDPVGTQARWIPRKPNGVPSEFRSRQNINKEGSKLKPTLFMIALLSLAATAPFGQQASNAPYLDPNLPPERRAADLPSRMTLEEKVLQIRAALLRFPALVYLPTIGLTRPPRRGPGTCHCFPTGHRTQRHLDTDLMHRVADTISTEARAKYHNSLHSPAPAAGEQAPFVTPGRSAGLTYWLPNINIFRDPRWGRGVE